MSPMGSRAHSPPCSGTPKVQSTALAICEADVCGTAPIPAPLAMDQADEVLIPYAGYRSHPSAFTATVVRVPMPAQRNQNLMQVRRRPLAPLG